MEKNSGKYTYQNARSASWKQTDSMHEESGEIKKKRGGCLPRLIPLFFLILLLLGGMWFFLRASLKKVERYALNEEKVIINDDVRASDKNMRKYQNIALFGVDSQDNVIRDKGSRTDCIIVASINKRSKKVKHKVVFEGTIREGRSVRRYDSGDGSL